MGGKSGGGAGKYSAENAARVQGEEARKLNQEQTFANRPNQYNPWGSTEWGFSPTFDPMTGEMINMWTQTETLNPTMQKSLDAQMGLQQGRSELAASMFGDAHAAMSTPHDFDQYGQPVAFDGDTDALRQKSEDAAYGRSTSRLDPQFEQQGKELEIKLRNQGLKAGDAAYDSQMAAFNRSKNDAYEQARMGSTLEGRQEASQMFGMQGEANDRANALRMQQIQEDLFQRGFTMSEIERLLSGQEIQGSTPSSG